MNYSGTITDLLNTLMDSGCPECQQKDSFRSFVQNQRTKPYRLNETLVKIVSEGNWYFECGNPDCHYKITKFEEIFRH